MGCVIDGQPPRKYREIEGDWVIRMAKAIAKEEKVALDQALYAIEISTKINANSIAIEDGDFRDEHASSYANSLKTLASVVAEIASSLDDFRRKYA